MARIDRSRVEELVCSAFALGMAGTGCLALVMGQAEPPEAEDEEDAVTRIARMVRCTVEDEDGGSVAGTSWGGTAHGTVTVEVHTEMGALELEDGIVAVGASVGTTYTAAGDAQRVINCLSRNAFRSEDGLTIVNMEGATCEEQDPPAGRCRAFVIVIRGRVTRTGGVDVAY